MSEHCHFCRHYRTTTECPGVEPVDVAGWLRAEARRYFEIDPDRCQYLHEAASAYERGHGKKGGDATDATGPTNPRASVTPAPSAEQVGGADDGDAEYRLTAKGHRMVADMMNAKQRGEPVNGSEQPLTDSELADAYEREKDYDGPIPPLVVNTLTPEQVKECAEEGRRLREEMYLCENGHHPGCSHVLTIPPPSQPSHEALVEALEDIVQQACLCNCGALPGLHVDSFTTSAYADAMRLLAGMGRLRVFREAGRRIIAEWCEAEAEGDKSNG